MTPDKGFARFACILNMLKSLAMSGRSCCKGSLANCTVGVACVEKSTPFFGTVGTETCSGKTFGSKENVKILVA